MKYSIGISVIVSVFNEEKTIKNIILSLLDISIIDEIIVVNDGSTDRTPMILENLKRKSNIIILNNILNRGKGYAMYRGVKNAKEELLVFIDADISNLKSEHIESLTLPVKNGEADMVLGQPSETMINKKVNPFKPLTGQRSLKKSDIHPVLKKMKNSRFGVETLLNLHFAANNKKIENIYLEGLEHPTKFHKTSFLSASKEFVSAAREIITTIMYNTNLIVKLSKNKLKKNIIPSDV